MVQGNWIKMSNNEYLLYRVILKKKIGSSVAGAPLRNLGKFVYPTLPVSFGQMIH